MDIVAMPANDSVRRMGQQLDISYSFVKKITKYISMKPHKLKF